MMGSVKQYEFKRGVVDWCMHDARSESRRNVSWWSSKREMQEACCCEKNLLSNVTEVKEEGRGVPSPRPPPS